ncbi:MAG: YkgJ family cysteine cluster protein [Bacteroidetes bacterium]|jgi:Fe-S-cluster containining protein|nr:YkgJ family cysteine cluster protein [Bacteroidota bacterium]
MKELENLKEAVLKEYPRMQRESGFRFNCHEGISCFNKCCADVNIFLTPYDVIRLKNRLKISSQEFLDKYTLLPIDESQNHPVVMLKMMADEDKSCPFVRAGGCSVYGDRPWSCRMFPLGVASPKESNGCDGGEFYFMIEEPVCQGYLQEKHQTVGEWVEEQGVGQYSEMGELFKEVSLHDFFKERKQLTPAKLEMFYTVCYNIDKFREFIFGSSFLKRFDVEEETVNDIRTDDEELLKFGFNWLKYCLFGDKTMRVRAGNDAAPRVDTAANVG